MKSITIMEWKPENITWGIIGFITGGITWLKLNMQTDVLQYLGMCFVALSAAVMGYVGKEIGKLLWSKVANWYKNKASKKKQTP